MKVLYKLIYRGTESQENVRDAQIKKAIDNLPEDNREAIRLHFLEKIPRKQIASHLNWSLSKVNQKITRGITLLKAELIPDHFTGIEKVIDHTTQRLLL